MFISEMQDISVLVVDDQPANVNLLYDYLVASGLKVLVAQDGESCLEKAEYAAPHAILLDVMMPGIDGFETCRRLKKNPKTQDIPVIFMTALSDTQYTIKGFDSGGADYVTKPFQHEEVLARLGNQLRIREYQLALAAKTKDLTESNRRLRDEIHRRQLVEVALQKANERLSELAKIDGLTGLANRRHFDEYLSCAWNSMARESKPITLFLCDIDYFKNYNDRYGHQMGDRCLQAVARSIRNVLPQTTDLAARYGGEEFALVLPGMGQADALALGEQLRASVEGLCIAHAASSVGDYVTLSIGICTIVPTGVGDHQAFLAAADRALYAAKGQGRNCCVVAYVDAQPPEALPEG
jgi:diguanylate cyclase (GGDEF)-like protein